MALRDPAAYMAQDMDRSAMEKLAKSSSSRVRWGELEEDDTDLDFPLPPPVVIGPDENGIKKIVEYRYNQDGHRVKVTTTMKVRKVERRKPNKRVQARREWKKFGGATEDLSNLTMVSAEQIFMERPGVAGSKKEEEKMGADSLAALADGKGGTGGTLMVCRICGKKGEHWTAKCPFKDLSNFSAESGLDKVPAPDASGGAAAPGGKQAYVPPSLRGDKPAADRAGDNPRRRDENSVRVTNLSEETREADLHELFRPFGPVTRVYVAVDQKTGASRGFGFVNFVSREDAQKAINKLNGYGYDNLILRVEWAGPRHT